MAYFLHQYGYTYLTIPKLTYPEIHALVKAKNRETKEKNRRQREQARKGKQKSKQKW